MSDVTLQRLVTATPYRIVFGAILVAGLTAACGDASKTSAKPASEDVWASVDGRDILRSEVEKTYQRTAAKSPAPSEEEALTLKLGLLNEMIVQDILVAKAAAMKLDVSETELDAAFVQRKNNMPDDAFQKELAARGLTIEDMRLGLRRELAAQKVVDREVTSKVSVTEKEITDFYDANRAQFNLPETAYHIAQIVITPTRDPGINNRGNDDATTPEAAAQKAQALMERLKAGGSFEDLAATYSEDPQTAPRGGDLGFVPLSALQKGPPFLRDAVLKATPGNVTLLSQGGAHTLMLLVAKEAAGQRDLTVPAVRDGITNTLRERKANLLNAAFLTMVRNDATVVNYLARRLVEAQGKPSGLSPAK